MSIEETENVRKPSDDEFWALVALARRDFDIFTKRLEVMDQASLIGFAWKFEEMAGPLYEYKYHKNQYSEDTLEDLCGWVVARGKDFYEEIIANPERMPMTWDNSEPGIDILYQAGDVYYERFVDEIPPYEDI